MNSAINRVHGRFSNLSALDLIIQLTTVGFWGALIKTILLCLDEDQVSPADRRQIARLFPDFQLVISRQLETISQVIANVEIVGGRFPREQMLDAPRLKWMQQWSAGADWILRPEMRQSEVVVTTASGIHIIQITEHIFSFMLAFARGLPAAKI